MKEDEGKSDREVNWNMGCWLDPGYAKRGIMTVRRHSRSPCGHEAERALERPHTSTSSPNFTSLTSVHTLDNLPQAI